ncbi:HEPN/Toprim-associated domain-containing protein [Pseudomonas sp.]|uniref:HEPN/Toprim-associated domain-containing protein n=1 Tax=Pseudomonas sp. TaxID=306 RepID=UPI0026279229|nr:HEPN/Toprim-associated domain-containing protein [Pseudomonas sp.]
MGTLIHLQVDGLIVDWAKNNSGNDHRSLFQESDRIRITIENDDEEDSVDYEYDALARPLSRIIPRLNLLGSTIETARAEYNALLVEYSDSPVHAGEDLSGVMSFDEFCEFVGRYSIESLDDNYVGSNGSSVGDVRGRFIDVEEDFSRLPNFCADSYWSEKSYFASRICCLSVYSMLQVFGCSENNINARVVWDYGSLVDAGWASNEEFTPGAIRSNTILVATEGSTDSRIIKRAFSALCPDLEDFFRFVDVDERHPFWGTGNLVKFAEGLVRIDIQNKVLFILDNDAEGVDAMMRLKELAMPSNMRAMLLPDDDTLFRFPAIGPEGTRESNINGRAAAIECYLDLRLPNQPPAVVRWSNYKKDVDAWQGALEYKETYMRYFLDQSIEALRKGDYDTLRLERLLSAITAEAEELQKHHVV